MIQEKVATFGWLVRSMVVTRPTSCGANTVLAALSKIIFPFTLVFQFAVSCFGLAKAKFDLILSWDRIGTASNTALLCV
jgi:hypothetical protein